MLKKGIFYLLAFFILSVGGLLVGEVMLRLIDSVNPKSTWLRMHERGFMENIPDRTNLHTLGDIEVDYTFSSIGTRGEEPDSAEKNIFVFGDSFTFGLFLPREDTFIHHLNETSGDSISFINAGVGGTGLADWVAQIEESLSNPIYANYIDGVMIVANYDDFARTLAKNLYVISADSTLIASKRWEERPLKKWLDEQKWFVTAQEHSHLISAVHSLLWPWYYVDITEQEHRKVAVPPMWDTGDEEAFAEYTSSLSQMLIKRLHEITLDHEISLFITTTGYMSEDKLTDLNKNGFDGFKRGIEEREIPFADITSALTKQINGDYNSITIPEDTHPDSTGAALIAFEIERQLFPLIQQ